MTLLGVIFNVRLTIGISLGIKLDKIHRILCSHSIMHHISVDDDVIGSKRGFRILFLSGLGYTFCSNFLHDVSVLPSKRFESY